MCPHVDSSARAYTFVDAGARFGSNVSRPSRPFQPLFASRDVRAGTGGDGGRLDGIDD